MRRQVARVDLGGFAALFIALRSLRLCAEFFRVPGLLEGVKRMDDFEVKADALEGAFDAVLAAEAVDELKASVAALKTQVDAQAVAASRLPLDGAKAAADPARDAFVERYLRREIGRAHV